MQDVCERGSENAKSRARGGMMKQKTRCMKNTVVQNPVSDVDGLESSDGGSCPLTDAREWAVPPIGASGGGERGLASNIPGDGVSVVAREIFSFTARSLCISASSSLRRACISLLAFSSAAIWFVARSKRETLELFWLETGRTSFNFA